MCSVLVSRVGLGRHGFLFDITVCDFMLTSPICPHKLRHRKEPA